MSFLLCLLVSAQANQRTITAQTLVDHQGLEQELPDIPGESFTGSASCVALARATLACSLYDERGRLQSGWTLRSLQRDSVTFEDPLFGRTAVTVPLAGAAATFSRIDAQRVVALPTGR